VSATPRPPVPEGPYLVVGLARSGTAVARVLSARGEVRACDAASPPVDLPGIHVQLESEGLDLLDGVRTVVKSPGVPQTAPVISAARSRGIEVIGELEVAWRLLPNEFVAVTGTNGKTTTTELVGAMHRCAGLPAAVAGNVGTALSSLVCDAEPDAVVVAECSSFQLEDSVAFAPETAVLINLAEDHLDRHGSFAAYRAAKLRIFERQTAADVAVMPHGFEAETAAHVVTFGRSGADLEHREDGLVWRGEHLLATDEVRLRGAHNLENAMAASAAALARGIPTDAVRSALSTFAGVEHRLEEVTRRDGVLYVNDSKATNVASTRVALEAFNGARIHLIAGGRPKPGGFVALRDLVAERCAAVYTIGEATDQLVHDLAGSTELAQAGSLDQAVGMAREAARPGEVVLLSPACASFDQYRDFEARGRHFRALVEA
jgi:UDP-N-acetylmuramoylalanine--D-glutamate ligase